MSRSERLEFGAGMMLLASGAYVVLQMVGLEGMGWAVMALAALVLLGSLVMRENPMVATNPPTRVLDEVLEWLHDAIAELDRAHAGYANVGSVGDTELYLAAKRRVFRHLEVDLTRAAREGVPALLRHLWTLHAPASMEGDLGREIHALVEAKCRAAVEVLIRHVVEGAPLPDPVRFI